MSSFLTAHQHKKAI